MSLKIVKGDAQHIGLKFRKNNPGNLEMGAFADRKDAIESDGRFAIFPTYVLAGKPKSSYSLNRCTTPASVCTMRFIGMRRRMRTIPIPTIGKERPDEYV